ncbi:hypothetical protein, conserved [Babesia bigemina]|uniref:Uncharacterized protein n=1 Tax=Babesia bigemina TaxID=5866 RepID=A0A061D7P8_BABBI|nr:hypothetical protein, conserved [Babesia bigemina]CDR94924.1 hypothetical protein, conserved [Babesia bigemina]|eukprot:XP_012767110.1 hypothetical protein, conserved [Babesia bigemina]
MRCSTALCLAAIAYSSRCCGHAAAAARGSKHAFLCGAAAQTTRQLLLRNSSQEYDIMADPLDSAPQIEYYTAKYPPYPYYDAPRNLFFDASGLKEANAEGDLEELCVASETQKSYMKNAEMRREGEEAEPLDDAPIASNGYFSQFDRMIGKDYRDYIYVAGTQHHGERMRTDIAEYDAVRPGIAPWPSYEQLKEDKLAVNTSLFNGFDTTNRLERHLVGKPMLRNDITTLGEARTEQRRWLRRSYADEWSLTYEEFAAMPLDMREAYYANRYQLCDDDEKFAMVLNYRRALGRAGDKMHPAEFRYMEDSYTYTPKDSPIAGDLLNWDDPLDAPWRLRVEECIRDCVTYSWPPERIRFHTCFEVYDVTWLAGVVKVVIEQTRDEGDFISPNELKLMLLKLEKRLKQLDEEEHTQSIATHSLMLVARLDPKRMAPEELKTLICRRDWNSHIGQEVIVTFTDKEASQIRGIMRGSHSVLALELDVEGRRHTLPLNFIREITLI